MEHRSINPSAVSKQETTPLDYDSVEESGWTAYFEDFWNYNHQQNSCCSSFSCGSSFTSNPATTRGPAWKSPPSSNNHHRVFPKKTRTKEICDCEEDDSLEDTASSPVNSISPKVTSDDWKSNNINPSKREDEAAHTCLESAENCSDIHIEQERKLNFHDDKNDREELNKRVVLGSFLHVS